MSIVGLISCSHYSLDMLLSVLRQEAIRNAREKETAERLLEKEKQLSEELKLAREENVRQLTMQFEKERKQLKQHYDEILDMRLKEQQKLAEEGFQRQADRLKAEIEELKRTPPPPPQKKGFFGEFLSVLPSVFETIATIATGSKYIKGFLK